MKGIAKSFFVLFVSQLIASDVCFEDFVWKDMMLVHGHYSWIPPLPFFWFFFSSISNPEIRSRCRI